MTTEAEDATPFRVLIAASDRSLLTAYDDFLSRNGFEVAIALDGLDCVGKLRNSIPEALVLRGDLPWGRCEGVLALMVEESDVPAIPVIVISSHSYPASWERSRTYSGAAYYAEPPGPAELAECLFRLRNTATRHVRQ